MKIIVFTLPDATVKNEAVRITEMLESGVIDRIHIRKPGMSADEIRKLIDCVPSSLHGRLSLHSNSELLREFPCIGWHFSDLRPDLPETGMRSRSCHSPAEAVEWAARCDYVTLSPVFDSISKPGYLSACFNSEDENICNRSGKVIALGGVTPKLIPSLKDRGYRGAAMLGYAWKTEINQLIEELKCYNS